MDEKNCHYKKTVGEEGDIQKYMLPGQQNHKYATDLG